MLSAISWPPSHSRVMRLRASTSLSQARRASLSGRTTNEHVHVTGDFDSSREKMPMGVTYVSGVRQKVLLQRAAHPHEPPLRPDPVGQVAHGDSAASVTSVTSVSSSTAWLSSPRRFTYAMALSSSRRPPTRASLTHLQAHRTPDIP